MFHPPSAAVPLATPAPAASSMAPTTRVEDADERTDPLWQTELFALALPVTRARGRASARQAFQGVLHGRGFVVDLRTDAQRRADGAIAGYLAPVELRPGADLSALMGAVRLYVVPGEADVDPAEFAALHPDRPEVLLVDGGFAAWVTEGLPVRRP